MTGFRIKAGERREIIRGPGGVGPELVFVAERADGSEVSGTVEETRSALVGAAVNTHPLRAENVFHFGGAAHSRTRTQFRLAVIPDQDVTVRIVKGYTSPARVLAIVALGIVTVLALIGGWAILG